MKKIKWLVLMALGISILNCSAVYIRVENYTTNSVPALIDGDDTFTYPPGITDFALYSTNVNVNINADEGWVCQDGYGFADDAHVILRLSMRYGDVRSRLFAVNQPNPSITEIAWLRDLKNNNVACASVGIGGLATAGLVLRWRSKTK